jgi:hypothetical protein
MVKFTSREVGMAAAFGGAAFAFRVLGLGLPGYPPGAFMDLGSMMVDLAGMAGGPIVGLIAGLGRGMASGLPMNDIFLCPFMGVLWAFVYKYVVLAVKNPSRRWFVLVPLVMLLRFAQETEFTYFLSLIQIAPFIPGWIGSIPTVIIYMIAEAIVVVGAIRAVPAVFGWKEGKASW